MKKSSELGMKILSREETLSENEQAAQVELMENRKMRPIDSSDYEDAEDDGEGQYEEVGFDDYENDEEGDIIVPNQ